MKAPSQPEKTWFVVCRNEVDESRKVYHVPLSRAYQKVERAKAELERFRGTYPNAYVVQVTQFI